jgi:2-oxoisovalerate dehydrogenase E1 component
VPTIFLIINNQYGMTGQQRGETSSIDYLARRAAGFCQHSMHAEVVNGMDPLAVRDAIARAAQTVRQGHGPVMREAITYRFHGHSLSDPRNEYRTRDEEEAWRAIDPLITFPKALIEAGVCSQEDIDKMQANAEERHARAAVRAAETPEPHPDDVARFLFSDGFENDVPEENTKVEHVGDKPEIKRDARGNITFKDAIKEALYEEMNRDNRVIIYGEDVADYGGAFKVTKGLLETFGRDRIFNTSISEAGIIGTAVGAAMTNMRPVVELMYSDFEFQAGDQIYNQAAKWSYMSGGQTSVPMVVRTSTGAGKGYGGQHSQSVESHSTHTPGLKVVVPSTPYDAKGLLKTAIRDHNPVMFVESQALYNDKAVVPEEEYLIPFGEADIKRKGKDVTIVAWGFMVRQALDAAGQLAEKHGLEAEVIDPRTLIPLDIDTILRSVKKTGRLIVTSQSCTTGSYTGEICSQVQRRAFDYLDAPIVRVGAVDAVSPQSYVLETAYLPNAAKVLAAAEELCNVKK